MFTIYPESAKIVFVLGDSHTNFGMENGGPYGLEAQHAAQLGYALAGLSCNQNGWPALFDVLSVSGSTVTLDRDGGACFQKGVQLQFAPAGAQLWQATQPDVSGPVYTVMGQNGDVLTLQPPPPAGLPAGTQVQGVGGGKNALVKNGGHSGFTTPQMLAVAPLCFLDGDRPTTPSLVIFGHATNDWNAGGSSTVQSTGSNSGGLDTFAVAPGKGATIASPGSYLTIGGQTGWLVTAVSTDTITAKPPSGTSASNLASGTTVAIDTQNTLIAIGQALLNRGVPQIAILSQKLDNLASGGDWNGSAFVKQSWKATLTGYQQAACAALSAQYGINVPYLDIWALMVARVNAGRDAAGSNCYEIYSTNTHPSVYGGMVMGALEMQALAAAGVLANL